MISPSGPPPCLTLEDPSAVPASPPPTPSATRRAVGALLALAVGALALGAAGCRIRDRDEEVPPGEEPELSAAEQEIVDDSVDLDGSTQEGTAIAAIPTLPLFFSAGPPTLAKAVEMQQLGARLFVPAGCATATAEGNVVTYEFDGCSGSYGLFELSGREIVTFRPGPVEGSTSLEMRSDELTLDGRPVDHAATVTVTFGASGKHVAWTGSFAGTTRRGLPFESAADLSLALDEETRCATLDGTTSGAVAGRGLDVTYEGFVACQPRGTCPAGRIEATGKVRRLTVAIDFDGSREAIVTTPRGEEVPVPLSCLPMGGP